MAFTDHNHVVYKYPLNRRTTKLMLPRNAYILSVGVQDNQAVLWAVVNPDNFKEQRTILCVQTDKKFSMNGMVFLGTCQFPNGIVEHIFEYKP